MLGRLLGNVFMAVICGFAVLVVCSMIVTGYIGGPARSFASAVLRATIGDLAAALNGPAVWLQQRL